MAVDVFVGLVNWFSIYSGLNASI